MKAELAVNPRCLLGEGPYYDGEHGKVLFVDIIGKKGLIFSPAGGQLEQLDFPEPVSALIPRRSGGYIATLASRVVTVGEDGAISDFTTADTNPECRSNEARTDSQGRLWLGTMQNNIGPNGEDLPINSSIGTLHRVDPDGSATRILDGIGIANTLVWSPDDTTLYFADTLLNRIDAFDYDAKTGLIIHRHVFTEGGPGAPDGSAMDADGCIWNARWGGACLLRYTPDGKVDCKIDLPVKQPTSCVFGGKGLSTLFITSARQGLSSPGELDGALLVMETDVKGMPCHPFAG